MRECEGEREREETFLFFDGVASFYRSGYIRIVYVKLAPHFQNLEKITIRIISSYELTYFGAFEVSLRLIRKFVVIDMLLVESSKWDVFYILGFIEKNIKTKVSTC